MTDQARLGDASIAKLVVKYSVPCVLSLLFTALYNIVDQIFIGNSELSTLGNAATGVVFPVFVIAQAFAWGFGDGCAAHLNIMQGRKQTDGVDRTIGACITLSLISSCVLMALFYPLETQFLKLFGASELSLGMAQRYMTIILAFFPAFILSNVMTCVIRADGSPGWAMAAIIAGAATNIVLDAAFIFGCKWGMAGAAWATAIGQVVSLVIALCYIPRIKTFKLTPKSFIPDVKRAFPAIKIGMSSFITQITIVAIALVGNYTLAEYGRQSVYGSDIPIAVMSIETKVASVVTNLIVGVVLGCQPIIGYNLGAKKYDRVRKLYLTILAYTVTIGIIATLVFELAPRGVLGIFGSPTNIPNPEDYWAFGERLFRIFLMLILCNVVIKMSAIFFQAVGKPIFSIVSSLIRDVVCFVPLLIALPTKFGLDGVLYSSPISDAAAFIVAVTLTIVYFVKLKAIERAEAKSEQLEQMQPDEPIKSIDEP